MSLVNFTAREITCKIVYYGPGRSGKTTNLQYVYGRVPESRGAGGWCRSRPRPTARCSSTSCRSSSAPSPGFTTKFQLYTVPGQSYYNATRKLVLQGADGVVFVADSQARRFDDNLESLQNLQDNLLAQGVDVRQLPVVFQYNKQDLPRDLILTHEEMDDALNFRAVPSFSADALHGTGVFETLQGHLGAGAQDASRRGAGRVTATLNPLYRFDTFVVGAANRLAVTAAKAVAESPGTVYNPLFIYARPGLGKTHLLMGIGHAARGINPGLVVEYLTLDEFVEAFHAAIAAGQGEAYRSRFLDVDLLLVDDVQFLTHRREMQSELLRLTDALQAANRQIVLTSDRPPAEIEALDERLIRRFAGGLVIDVAAPDYETRVAILRRKAEERRATFGDGVLEAVAGLAIDNVRELLGALNRLVAFQAVSDAPLTPEQARRMIGGVADPQASAAQEATAAGPSRQRQRRPMADEFADFLSEISATVAQQVDAWRTQVGPRHPALGRRGVSHRPARGAAGAGDRGRSRPGARTVRRPTCSGSAHWRRRRPSSRPISPAQPPSATRATCRRPRRSWRAPAKAPIPRQRPRRSGDWTSWSRPPATGWRSSPPSRSPRSRATGTTRS